MLFRSARVRAQQAGEGTLSSTAWNHMADDSVEALLDTPTVIGM